MKLQIDTVHQPQRLERILGKFAGKTARNLIAELLNAAGDKGMVEFVVTVHRSSFP
jgi:hypothetical protein